VSATLRLYFKHRRLGYPPLRAWYIACNVQRLLAIVR
jgi:hypothetical protein